MKMREGGENEEGEKEEKEGKILASLFAMALEMDSPNWACVGARVWYNANSSSGTRTCISFYQY